MEGFYSVVYSGSGGMGFGMLVLSRGIVVGANIHSVTFDGRYQVNEATNALEARITTSAPAGVPLPQGIPAQRKAYSFTAEVTLPVDIGKEKPVNITTPFGTITALFKRIRNLSP
jgi:hypothetical protein